MCQGKTGRGMGKEAVGSVKENTLKGVSVVNGCQSLNVLYNARKKES